MLRGRIEKCGLNGSSPREEPFNNFLFNCSFSVEIEKERKEEHEKKEEKVRGICVLMSILKTSQASVPCKLGRVVATSKHCCNY